MAKARENIFLVCTKRIERLLKLADRLPWADNIWLGVTVERADYIYRIDLLRQIPAHTRFLSCEPLLGPLLDLNLEGIHWMIAGGK